MAGHVRIKPDIVEWREVEGEVVGIDTRSATYFAVNRTGALLWKDLLDGTSREKLVEKLQAEFSLDREAAERDVDAFIATLAEQDILAA